jgi:hypothetical protein
LNNPTTPSSISIFAYRDVPIRTLLAERECWSWELASLESDPGSWQFAEQSRAYITLKLNDIQGEIERRRRLRNMPHAPKWPESPEDGRAELEEIKRRLELVSFIETYTPVRFAKSGDELKACCPFLDHDDSTPSFFVHPGKQVFYCFGCGRKGDLFEFARHFFGFALFHDAADVLRQMAGIPKGIPVPDSLPTGNGNTHSRGDSFPLGNALGGNTRPRHKKPARQRFTVRGGKIEPR